MEEVGKLVRRTIRWSDWSKAVDYNAFSNVDCRDIVVDHTLCASAQGESVTKMHLTHESLYGVKASAAKRPRNISLVLLL